MKQMVYGDRQIEVLHKENYLGYDFYVVSLGTHPCIYVAIPEGHPWHGLNYSDVAMDIEPHFGLTFSGQLAECDHQWCIGWDYAHCDDCYYPVLQGKKWTTEELIIEAHRAIEQFPELRDTIAVAANRLRRATEELKQEARRIWCDVLLCIFLIVAVMVVLVWCAWRHDMVLTVCNIFYLITWMFNLFTTLRFRHWRKAEKELL